MAETADVVIVGAGVMGCGVAYWLSKEGYRVVVLEADAIACGASGMGAAQMSAAGPEDRLPDLVRASLKLHRELSRVLPEESGVDIGYRENPAVRPAFTEGEAEGLRALFATWKAQDPSVQWLEGPPLWELEPRLSRAALAGLVFNQAQVLASRFVLALARAAESRGAEIRHGEVVGLEGGSGRVAGVRLSSGTRVWGERVVLAMGPWSQRASSWTGLRIPIYPLRGQLLELQVPDPQLGASLVHGDMYVVPKADGLTLAGTTKEPDAGFDNTTTEAGARLILDATLRLAPSLGQAAIRNHLAGLRPASEDGLPLMGSVPGWQGLYVLTGHSANGIKLSAISARMVADLIARGRNPVPMDAFDPGRFGRAG